MFILERTNTITGEVDYYRSHSYSSKFTKDENQAKFYKNKKDADARERECSREIGYGGHKNCTIQIREIELVVKFK